MTRVLPVHRLDVPDLVRLPFAIGTFDTIGPLSRADFPHRHTFYEVQYVTAGSGWQVIDRRARRLDPPQLGVIGPGRVHWWEGADDVRGWVLLFQDDFLLGHAGEREMLRELGASCPWFAFGSDRSSAIASLIDEMNSEYAERAPGYASVLRSYLHVLLTRVYRWGTGTPDRSFPARPRASPVPADSVPAPSAPSVPVPSTSSELVAHRFLEALAESTAAEATVREYATRLGVSVSHLTESVKHATGRTPARLIREDRVLEAKRLLAAGRLTVGQVARAVGFADPAYFCRFFRRETGLSPGGYRRRTGVEEHHDRGSMSIDALERYR